MSTTRHLDAADANNVEPSEICGCFESGPAVLTVVVASSWFNRHNAGQEKSESKSEDDLRNGGETGSRGLPFLRSVTIEEVSVTTELSGRRPVAVEVAVVVPTGNEPGNIHEAVARLRTVLNEFSLW